MMKTIEEKKEDFQYWLFGMDDDIEKLKREVSEFSNLDFSVNSLEIIENWILKNFKSKEELLIDNNKFLLDKMSKYVGEVFRKNLGGKWYLELENKNDAYYGIPAVKGGHDMSSPIAPATLLTACISREKGDYISSILQNKL